VSRSDRWIQGLRQAFYSEPSELSARAYLHGLESLSLEVPEVLWPLWRATIPGAHEGSFPPGSDFFWEGFRGWGTEIERAVRPESQFASDTTWLSLGDPAPVEVVFAYFHAWVGQRERMVWPAPASLLMGSQGEGNSRSHMVDIVTRELLENVDEEQYPGPHALGEYPHWAAWTLTARQAIGMFSGQWRPWAEIDADPIDY
jgi:hypothetical protein